VGPPPRFRHRVLDAAALIALSHHERSDGTGYPHERGGKEIPIEASVVGLADAFDSLIRDRPYRPALELSHALELVRSGRGTQFDPDVVDAFFAAEKEIHPGVGVPGPSGRNAVKTVCPLASGHP